MAGKLTQEKLGQLTGMDGKVIGEIERGERNPTLETVERLVRGLGVEPYEPFLFTFRKPQSPGRLDEGVLLNMIRHADDSVQPFLFNLLQAGLVLTQRKKK